MKSSPTITRPASPWPHRWAWVLACATFPLIWVGGFVTTTDAGMAFRDWLTSDGHFMLFYPWLSAVGDKFVEHGHRLLGALVGFLSIMLVIVVYRTEPRAWTRRFSLVILAGVVLQGVLGGMRVVLDERTLALIHGCTGPLFFALCVAMVVFTSPRWYEAAQANNSTNAIGNERIRKLFQLALVCTGLAYGQLILGAIVRHAPHMGGQFAATAFQSAVYFHLLVAGLLMVYVFLLAWRCYRVEFAQVGSLCLLALMLVQLGLGASTWFVKYGMPAWATALVGQRDYLNTSADALQAVIITSHVAVGSLITVGALAIALLAGRSICQASSCQSPGARRESQNNRLDSHFAPPNSQLSMEASR